MILVTSYIYLQYSSLLSSPVREETLEFPRAMAEQSPVNPDVLQSEKSGRSRLAISLLGSPIQTRPDVVIGFQLLAL